jgi:hypothetical protein
MYSHCWPRLLVLLLLTALLLACQNDPSIVDNTPDVAAVIEAESEEPATAVPPTATNTPEPTETPEPTATLEPTATPEPTETPTPTATPGPELAIQLQDETDTHIAAAHVMLTDDHDEQQESWSDEEGMAVFSNLPPITHTVTISAAGYLPLTHTLAVQNGRTELDLVLTPGYRMIAESPGNLRAGPGTAYGLAGSLNEGDEYWIIGHSQDDTWLVVLLQLGDEETAWLATSLVEATLTEMEIDLARLATVEAPPLPTTPVQTEPTETTDTTPPADTDEPSGPPGFDPHQFRQDIDQVRINIEQIGGQLDRLIRGEPGGCDEFARYYVAILLSPFYDDVPPAWHGPYNGYIAARLRLLDTNRNIMTICSEGGGVLDEHGYGVARSGVAEALDILHPVMHAADALLGQ